MSQAFKPDGYIPDIPPPPYSREDPATDEVASAPPPEDLKIADQNYRVPDSDSSFFYPRDPYEAQSSYGSSSATQPAYQHSRVISTPVPCQHKLYNTFPTTGGAATYSSATPPPPTAAHRANTPVSSPPLPSAAATARSPFESGMTFFSSCWHSFRWFFLFLIKRKSPAFKIILFGVSALTVILKAMLDTSECSPESIVPPDSSNYEELPVRIPATASVYINVDNKAFGGGSIALMPATTIHANETRILIPRNSGDDSNRNRLPPFDYSYDQGSGNLHINVNKSKGWRCSALRMFIMVPSNASWITVSTANVLIILPQHLNIAGQLSLKTKNAKVILKGGWSGELLDIGTSNSEIMIEGKVDAVSSVRLKTTNGAIKVLGTCSISNGPMDAATSNGQIIVKKMLTQSSVSLVTSNAKVIADAVYAKNLDIKTSNGGIEVKHSSSDGKISLVTSNAKVSAFVASATNVQVQARTSHGEIRLDMPKSYQGLFDVSTSLSQAEVIDTYSPGSIVFKVNRSERKVGYKTTPANNASIIASTSHSKATLTFDVDQSRYESVR